MQVCVLRAAPLEPGSPVAKELRCGSSPFKADWQQQQQELSSSSVADAGDGRLGPDVNHSTDAAATACDIIGFEQRKVGPCVAGVGVSRHTSQIPVTILAVCSRGATPNMVPMRHQNRWRTHSSQQPVAAAAASPIS